MVLLQKMQQDHEADLLRQINDVPLMRNDVGSANDVFSISIIPKGYHNLQSKHHFASAIHHLQSKHRISVGKYIIGRADIKQHAHFAFI